jgi:hypothetical protein
MQSSKKRFDLDLDTMLAKCGRLQWSVDDIDWTAPGAEVVDDAMRTRLVGFMSDLHWIEAIAARVFAAMSKQAAPPLQGIFASFSLDEQRHADAELALMRRWGIVGRGAPALNTNARNLLAAVERGGDRVHPCVYAAIIPFTELVLDGALVKHLDAQVPDPVSNEVFRKINADEARHLAIDFYMLESTGARPREVTAHMARALIHPAILYALFLGYLPLLPRMRKNIAILGLPEERLLECVQRYIDLGDESASAARHPTYAFFRFVSRGITRKRDGALDFLLRLSDLADRLDLRMAP